LRDSGSGEYPGSYLNRAFGEEWYGGRKFTVAGDLAAESANTHFVVIWKRVR
jgi:hypothetical protein